MDNKGGVDLLEAFKKLIADNNSQKARLEEYEKIINSRNGEIEMLQKIIGEANEYRSSTDNRLDQLKDLQYYISDLQHQVGAAVNMASGTQYPQAGTESAEQQLEDLKSDYAYLQVQLTNLQLQLQQVNKQNILLQQQVSRIAELESLLTNQQQAR